MSKTIKETKISSKVEKAVAGDPNFINTELLRKARKAAGFTQAELAKKIGISRESAVALEGGHVKTLDAMPLPLLREFKRQTVGGKEPNEGISESLWLEMKAEVMRYFDY